jgi:hypothetical protein
MVGLKHHQLIIKRRSVAGAGLLAVTLLSAGLLAPGCYQTDEIPVPLVIDENGVIAPNEFGISGQWYVYGDAYGNPKSCTDVGKHPEGTCSRVDYPPVHLPELGFPNREGKMCAFGVVGKLLKCPNTGECSADDPKSNLNCRDEDTFDYSNMWGAGIGFDLGLVIPPPSDGPFLRDFDAIDARVPWNAGAKHVKGISFVLDWHAAEDEIPMRIEFPVYIKDPVKLPSDKGTARLVSMGTSRICGGEIFEEGSSEEHSLGSPFWQLADAPNYGPSTDLQQGRNTVLWGEVYPPPVDDGNYLVKGQPIEPTQLMGVQFHVIPDTEGKREIPFSFCISDVRFLKE